MYSSNSASESIDTDNLSLPMTLVAEKVKSTKSALIAPAPAGVGVTAASIFKKFSETLEISSADFTSGLKGGESPSSKGRQSLFS